MFPHLETNSEPTVVPMPRLFRPVAGPVEVKSITPTPEPLKEPSHASTTARANGLRYERTVQEYVRDIAVGLGFDVLIQPTIKFRDGNEIRVCRPDIIIDNDMCQIVCEVKIQHMPEAWWQLRKLYQPVLEAIKKPVYVLEIVKMFDAAMPFPEHIHLVENFVQYLAVPRNDFAVFVWRP